MKRLSLIALICFLSIGYLQAKVPVLLLPSEKESVEMLNEADDFIDDMPDAWQDRQADAVLHAIRGQFNELYQLRKNLDAAMAVSANVVTKDFIGDGSARGLKMRLYKPKNASKTLPLLVYLHGGGWATGGLNGSSAVCDALAATGTVMVLAVDYSLAPERPYPGAVMECVGAVEYAEEHAKEWGSSPKLVSLGGDSTGANLALATALYMEKGGVTKDAIKSLVLYYPVTKGYRDDSASWKKYSRGYGLDSRLLDAYLRAYLSGGDAKDPMVSPGDASAEALRKLPPALIISAERDIVADQGKELASKLSKADHVEFPGTVHLFMTAAGQPTAFAKAIAITADYLHPHK